MHRLLLFEKDTMAAIIPINGGDVSITAQSIDFHPTELSAALGTFSQFPLSLPTTQITRVSVLQEPTAYLSGQVLLHGTDITVSFAPNFDNEQRKFVETLSAVLRGELVREQSIEHLDFVAIDVETANSDWGSICQIGVVRFIGGTEVAAQQWLCKPPAKVNTFDEFNIGIHGIQAEDVSQAPEFQEIFAEVTEFIGLLPVIAHNAQFDMTALSRATMFSNMAAPALTFSCTLTLARSMKLPIANHKLPTVAGHFKVKLAQHHDALADARACGEIMVALASSAAISGSLEEITKTLGFSMGTINGTTVYPVLKRTTTLSFVKDSAAATIGNTQEATTEKQSNKKARTARWAKAAVPEVIPEPNLNADPTNELFGHNVTLTGDFAPFDKGEIWEKIANHGATIGKNVTKKTTILILGQWDSITSKQKKAEEYIAKGQSIDMWSQEKLYEVLGLEVELTPPF
ncbi:putative DNA polymerase III epsilon subunit [Corynebacterium kutscheri]|nr:putative DNA polymerase III epsilon subunit [Corynebacterium kutscheri]